MRRKDPRELQRVLCAGLALMDLSLESLTPNECRSLQDAAKYLEEIKARVKKAYKKAALKHHPDRPDGDEEKMKILSAAMEIVESLRVKPPAPPPPPMRVVRVVQIVRVEHYGGGFSNTSTTTGASVFRSWTGGGGGGTGTF